LSIDIPNLPQLTISELARYRDQASDNGHFAGKFEVVSDKGQRFVHFLLQKTTEVGNPWSLPEDRIAALGNLLIPVHEVSVVATDMIPIVSIRAWSLRQVFWSHEDTETQRQGDYWDGFATGVTAASRTALSPDIGPILEVPAEAGVLYVAGEQE